MDTRTGKFLTPTVEVRGEVEGIEDAESVTYELRVRICSYSSIGLSLTSSLGYRLSDYDKSKTLALGGDRKGRVTLITFISFRF